MSGHRRSAVTSPAATLFASFPAREGRGIDPGSFAARQLALLMPEIAVMLAVTLLCTALYHLGGEAAVNVIAPLTILVTAAIANFMMVRQESNALLTPLFGLRLIALVVMGAGSLYDVAAPDFVRERSDYLFVTSVADAAKVNLVWLTGMDMLLIGVAAGLRIFAYQGARRRLSSLGAHSFNVGLITFLAGFFVTSLATIADTFEFSRQVPSSIGSVAQAIEFTGLFIVGRDFDRNLLAKVVVVVGLIALTFLSLISLNKSVLLYPALIAVLGIISFKINVRRIIIGSAVIVTLFALINPVTNYTRIRNLQEHGQSGQASLRERLGYAQEYMNGEKLPGEEIPAIARVDYVMPAAFVIYQFDNGMPSDELKNSGYMFIPRFLWRDKPISSNSGLVISQLLGIQSVNQIGVTTFADLYWNAGWWGLVLVLPLGIYFGAMTIATRNILADGDWIMFPFVLSIFAMSLNLDKDYMAALVIPVFINTGLYYLLRIAGSLLPSARRSAVGETGHRPDPDQRGYRSAGG